MGIRVFCLMLLGFTLFGLALVPTYTALPLLAHIGMYIFYGGSIFVFLIWCNYWKVTDMIENVARAKADAQKLRWDHGIPVRVLWRDGRAVWSKINDEGRDLTADNSDGMLHHVQSVFVPHGAINPLSAIAAMTVQAEPVAKRWQLGDKVHKKRGSAWRGTVCGFYSTPHTPEGYCVDSAFEPGSVQVWPEAALEDWDGGSDAE